MHAPTAAAKPMSTPAVLVERRDHVAILTFNREERHHTLAQDLVRALRDALHELAEDRSVRALVITATGAKAFCAGADLRERRGMNNDDVRKTVAGLQALTTQIANFPRPVLCALNGVAFGGGLEIALACDLRYAAASAKMGLTETRLAIIPGAGGTQRLPRLIGLGRAKEMIFTGRRIDAATAAAWGLVEGVFDADQLHAEVLAIAHEIAQGGPIALESAKFAIQHGIESDLSTGLAIERAAYDLLIPTEDRVEALVAFGEKRPARFQGR